MRDWNLLSDISHFPSWLKFVEYLWGIETIYSWNSWTNWTAWFVEYLWGIETLQKQEAFLVFLLFVEYLWGIETSHDITIIPNKP